MFTKSELSGIIQSTKSLKLNQDLFIPTKSGDGLVSVKFIRDGLKDIIVNHEDRITLNTASKQLDIDDKHLTNILPTITEDFWGINGRQIITRKPFLKLQDELEDQIDESIVLVWKFCREKDISIDVLKKLMVVIEEGKGVELEWLEVEKSFYGVKFFEECMALYGKEINQIDEPVELADIPSAKKYDHPALYCQRMVTKLLSNGSINGSLSGSVFTPNSYKIKKQDEALELLKGNGYIEYKTLKRAYIDNPTAFLEEKLPTAALLDVHFVTQGFTKDIERKATTSLDSYGFAAFRDLAPDLTKEEQVSLRETFRKKQNRKLFVHGENHLVTQELIDEYLRLSTEFANEEASKAWELAVRSNRSIPRALEWGALLSFITPDHREVPLTATMSVLKNIHPKANARFTQRLNELQESSNTSAKLHFVDKIYLRLVVNLNAVLKIQDASLQDKLATDLLVYYQKLIVDGLYKLLDRVVGIQSERKNELIEDAIKTINDEYQTEPSVKNLEKIITIQKVLLELMEKLNIETGTADILQAKKCEMQNELKSQLEKATDPSLLILVVLILLFSELQDGILRATGKYAPKLLKALKPQLSSNDYDFLSSVKSAVIEKKQLSIEDVENLRRIGLNCGGS